VVLRHTAVREGKLLSFLRRELHMSSGLVSRLKFRSAFFVDGAPAFTDRQVLPGQEITVIVEETPQAEFLPEGPAPEILYEDESLLLLDKPSGQVVHPTWNRLTGTLLNQVLYYYTQTNQPCGVHPVNRLDRDTRGVVLLAKNSHVHGLLYRMQLRGDFEKTYHALCLGKPAQAEGSCDLPIRRTAEHSLLREVHPDGAPALTRYRVLETRDGLCRLALEPVTGRTHQLRVHCLAMGLPMLGDGQYYTEESRQRSEAMGLSGQQLAAVRLAFPHPLTGAPVDVRSKQDIFL